MIIVKSDIHYLNYGVLELNYKCNLTVEINGPSKELVIDLNYEILKIVGEKNIFQIILDLKLSPELNSAGYNMFLKFFGVFELPATDDKKKIDQALLYTCLPLLLGSARGFIAEITTNFPFGKYMLPSLAIDNIIQASKNVSISNEIENKKDG